MARFSDPRERLLSKIVKADDGCWIWQASKKASGYGAFYLHGRLWNAHRASYTLFVGPIPEGLTIDHLCRVPSCVNPEHLEAVTPGENTRRALPHYDKSTGVLTRSTHCIHGHEYTAENTYWLHGQRFCIPCRRNRSTAAREKRRAAMGPDSRARSKRTLAIPRCSVCGRFLGDSHDARACAPYARVAQT